MTPNGVVATVASAVMLLASCSASPPDLSEDELEQRAVDLLMQLPVDPLDADDFEVTASEVKLDDPYVSAHGVGDDVPAVEMTDSLLARLDADGFEIRHRRPIDAHLGYEVLASDGQLVLRAQIGPGIAGSAMYPPLDGGSYVAVQLANIGGGPGWTDVGR